MSVSCIFWRCFQKSLLSTKTGKCENFVSRPINEQSQHGFMISLNQFHLCIHHLYPLFIKGCGEAGTSHS